MLRFIGSLAKVAVGVAIDTPLALAKDSASLMGLLDEKKGDTFTEEAIQRLTDNMKNAVDPKR